MTALKSSAASLTVQLAEATAQRDKANGDLLNFKRNSGNWAEELEKDYAELKLNEIPKLNRLLDKRDADISALEKLLSTEKTAAKSAADDFTATIAGLNAQLSTARADSAVATTQAQNLAADKLALNKQIDSLKTSLEKATADAAAAQKALEQKVAEADKNLRRSRHRPILTVMRRSRRWNKALAKNAAELRRCRSSVRMRPQPGLPPKRHPIHRPSASRHRRLASRCQAPDWCPVTG